MPVSTAKAAVSTGLVGGGGIIGTTIPSVNLSSVKAENEKLIQTNQELEQAKITLEKDKSEESQCYLLISKRLMQYQWKYHYDGIRDADSGNTSFKDEFILAFYALSNKFSEPSKIEQSKCDKDLKELLKKLPSDTSDVVVG